MKDIFAIAYVSNARTDLTMTEIDELFKFVIDFNTKNTITGILLYKEGDFMQIIEGTKKSIVNLYNRILNDNRHKNVITLYNNTIEGRIFESYETGFTVLKDFHHIEKLNEYFEWVKESGIANVNKLINLASKFITK